MSSTDSATPITMPASSRGTSPNGSIRSLSGTHKSVLAPEPVVEQDKRPNPRGNIFVGPSYPFNVRMVEAYAEAVREAGMTVSDHVNDQTTGIIYLDTRDLGRAAPLQQLLETYPSIKWIQLPMAGVNAFESLITSPLGKTKLWTSAKGACAQPVAEHALALALATLRVFPSRVKATSWGAQAGASLFGARVLCIGAGGIALALLDLLKPFNVDVTVMRRQRQSLLSHPQVKVDSLANLDAYLSHTDVIFLAAAATAETHKRINAHTLSLLPPHAIVVNVARGTLVDTDALVTALEQGQIAGAAMDVTDPEPLSDGHPLWKLSAQPDSNVLITPHTADTMDMIIPQMQQRISVNVQATVRGDGAFIGRINTDIGY